MTPTDPVCRHDGPDPAEEEHALPDKSSNDDVTTCHCELLVDNRERDILDIFEDHEAFTLNSNENQNTRECRGIIRSLPLDVGDFQIRGVTTTASRQGDHDHSIIRSSSVPMILIERKTLDDMCASIKDGRYREQKTRILNTEWMGHVNNIVYVLEGCTHYHRDLEKAARKNSMNSSTLKSCVHNLMFRDGIHVVFTSDQLDTAHYVNETWKRVQKHGIIVGQSDNKNEDNHTKMGSTHGIESALIASCTHSKKNKNITHRTCFLMQLCQIPGVSEKIARSISENWPTMHSLYADLADAEDTERMKTFAKIPGIGKTNARKIIDFMFPKE